MKKLAIVIMLLMPFIDKAITITSVTAGGNWFTASTWSDGKIPANNDDVIINCNVTTPSSWVAIANNITINSGDTLTINAWSLILGTITNNGTLIVHGTVWYYTGTTITSTTTGGNWDSASTWIGGVVPSINDDVIIAGNVTETTGGTPQLNSHNVTINSGKTLTLNGQFWCFGLLTNNGTFTGNGVINIRGAGITVLKGAGVYSYTGTYSISSNSSENDTIASDVTISNTTYFKFRTDLWNTSCRMVNMGSITLTGGDIYDGAGSVPCAWYNGPNSYLSNTIGPFQSTSDTLIASASGNTIAYTGTSNYNIKEPLNNKFYNLKIDNTGIKTFTFSPTLLGSLFITSTGKLNVAGYNMVVDGNWINNISTGSITNNTGTVTINGSINDTIGGSTTTTFDNLIINSGSTTYLTKAEKVSNNLSITSGTLNCQTYQITGNATGIFSMASGTTLDLGSTTSSTNVSFPYNFTSSHISLDPNSTVTYQANTNQTISDTATYGNLILNTGSSSTTKTTSSYALTVAGMLTINSNTTMSGLGSGTLTLGGSLTNNGTFTYSTSTVTCNGGGSQTIGGISPATFYNLNISGTGTVDLGYNLAVNNNLAISSGTLDVTNSNYNMTIGGNFTKTGGTLTAHSNTLTMNGSSPTLGGSSTITANKLVIAASGIATLGGNVTLADSLRINSGSALNASSYTITLKGNFTNNGTFTCNSSTVYFNNNGKQCINGATSTETFNNLTVGPTSKLGTSCTSVNLGGTVTILPGGEMSCNCN